jgi:PLP dependent protein
MLEANLNRLRAQVSAAAERAGRSPADIRLIAVTKTVGVEQVRAAAALGLRDFGENRLQEAAPKLQALPELCWHFIGHIQTNKVKEVLKSFALIHSLDRLSLAEALQHWGEKQDREAAVLVQVNVSGEASKFGLEPAALPGFLEALRDYPRIRVEGLMTMAPFVDDPEEARPVFRRLRELRSAGARPGMELRHLSMGMTGDFEVAIEEGATMVRIGTALFGSRRD